MAIQLCAAGLPKSTVMFTGACLTSAALCDVISAIWGIPWSGRVMGAGGAGIGRLSSGLRRGSREGIGGHQSRRTNACQTHNRCCLSSSPSHSAEPWEELQMCHHSSLVVSLSLAYITSQYTTAFLRTEDFWFLSHVEGSCAAGCSYILASSTLRCVLGAYHRWCTQDTAWPQS